MGECQVDTGLIAQNYNNPLVMPYHTLGGSERDAGYECTAA